MDESEYVKLAMDSVYMNTLRFRDTYVRLLAIAPQKLAPKVLRQCCATAASTLRILESLARFLKRKVHRLFSYFLHLAYRA